MGLATLPSPSEGMFILLLVNTATSFAVVKDLFRVILHAVGINLPSKDSDYDPSSAAWASPTVSPDQCQKSMSCTQQLIEVFRSYLHPIHFNKLCVIEGDCLLDECSVCLNKFEPESKINKLVCGHVFHNACLEKWLGYSNTTCPLCRTPMMPQEEEAADCFFN